MHLRALFLSSRDIYNIVVGLHFEISKQKNMNTFHNIDLEI